ncbi:hypothetical protein [Streptomyces sp. NPDC018045]|uniref:hypothetical protein n=1 Tax=Streptomyces sp. NPDC018045 TaxID=3365037 RepID=UPI0037B11DB0
MKEFYPERICAVCREDLDELEIAYGDCPVCEQFVCEGCDDGYDPTTGQMVCPDHAADPRAKNCTE